MNGQLSFCAYKGVWRGKCGRLGANKEWMLTEGLQTCRCKSSVNLVTGWMLWMYFLLHSTICDIIWQHCDYHRPYDSFESAETQMLQIWYKTERQTQLLRSGWCLEREARQWKWKQGAHVERRVEGLQLCVSLTVTNKRCTNSVFVPNHCLLCAITVLRCVFSPLTVIIVTTSHHYDNYGGDNCDDSNCYDRSSQLWQQHPALPA